MKFSDILEDLLNEGKKFSDENFKKFIDNAGDWLLERLIDATSDVRILPGVGEYVEYFKKKSRLPKEELENLTWDDIVYSLPDYYGDWLNTSVDEKQSNKYMGDTITRFNLRDKMLGREDGELRKKGRKPKVQNIEPDVTTDAAAHFDQAVEKKKRGRKPMAPELRAPKKKYNYYVPTGRPMGRPKKVVEPTNEPELTLEPTDEPVLDTPKPKKSYYTPTGKKSPGRPPKYEPKMVDTRIKTLEDRIASLEALLREKGILEEQRTLLESRLQMMKDYQKFL